MTNTEIATLVIGSGLAAGFVTGLVTLVSGRWERKHRTNERTAVEQHEARLRREAAHDEARATFLPTAEQFVAWANKHAHDLHWELVGDFIHIGTKLPVPTAKEEVLDCLRVIMYGHPTKAVREHARSLCSDIEMQWTEITAGGLQETSLDQALDWLDRSETLIDMIHAPEGGRDG